MIRIKPAPLLPCALCVFSLALAEAWQPQLRPGEWRATSSDPQGGVLGGGVIAELDRPERDLTIVPGARGGLATAGGLQLFRFFPQAGRLWEDLIVNNHVDLALGPDIEDFNCTDRTYNGHNGHDIDIPGFREQALGIPIFAALDGTVIFAHDGEDDMNTTAAGQTSNAVGLDHGGGQRTWYFHLKRNSVAVTQNQFVVAGTQLGLTGSSGLSTWPHLHFESHVNAVVREPSSGPCNPVTSLWSNQVPVPTATIVRTFAFGTSPFTGTAGYPWDQAALTGTFVVNTVATYFRLSLGNWPGGTWRVTYTRPDGTIAADLSNTNVGAFRAGWLHFQINPAGGLSQLGTWTTRLFVNNELLVTAPFAVVANAGAVVNRAPFAVTVSLNPASPTPADAPQCNVTPPNLYRRDPDYDVVRYRYRWIVNGTIVREVFSAALSDTLRRSLAGPLDSLTCEVVPLDATLAGPTAIVTSTPLGSNLIVNGSFSSGMSGWGQFALPTMAHIVSQVSGGVLEFYRQPASSPDPSDQAVVLQGTHAPVGANVALVAQFDLQNSSSARKRISVLIHDEDFSDLSVCTFWLPAGAPMRTYRMETHTTEAWIGATISFYAASVGSDGGFYRVDNVSLTMAIGGDADRTECVDPAAPSASPVSSGELLINGGFTSGLTGWFTFGQLVYQLVGGVFEFYRPPGVPSGLIWQITGQTMVQGQSIEAAFQLGNSSSVRKRVTVIIQDDDFSDLSACTLWLPPGQLLQPYLMRSYATKPWTNARISIYPATLGTETSIRLDNVSLRRISGVAIVGTQCLEPGAAFATIQSTSSASASSESASPLMRSSTPSSPRGSAIEPERQLANEGFVSLSNDQRVLELTLDLRAALAARLRFESRHTGVGSRAEVHVSADGLTWSVLAVLPASDGWLPAEILFHDDADGVVHVRFVLNGVPVGGDDGAPVWTLRGITIR